MATYTLTIMKTPEGAYATEQATIQATPNDSLTIVVPNGGCRICLSAPLSGATVHDLAQDRTMSLAGAAPGTIRYSVAAQGAPCAPPPEQGFGHVIIIGS